MNFNLLTKIPKPILKTAYGVGTFFKKNAPELLLGAGVATSVAGLVTAINGSPKAAVALDEIRTEIEYAGDDATMQDKFDIVRAHIKDVVSPFALPVAFEGISLTCFLTSYGVMKRRHAALTLAYQALDLAFTQYRQRVIADLGPERDYYYRTGIVEGTCTVMDEETGELKEETGKILTEKSGSSIYARYFDEHSKQWKRDPQWNMLFLKGAQKEFYYRLISRGYVFLNEVYEHLGLPLTAEGQVVGWINDPEYGSCTVDFGITEGFKLAKRMKENNIYDRAILLDFNVDGPIYEFLNLKNARAIAAVTPGANDILPEYAPSEVN